MINTDVDPPDSTPNVNEVPIKNPMGRGTVSFPMKFNWCFLLKFCDPRQRKKNSNSAEAIFRVKSCNLKNI